MTRFCRQIGSGVEFVTGYGAREKRWCKLSFEIEVAELEGNTMSCEKSGGHRKVAAEDGNEHNGVDRVDGAGGVGKSGGMNEVSVTLDPEEHQAYAWVTEEEIKEGKYAIVTAEQKILMLEAFTSR